MPRPREPPVFFIDHCLGTEKVAQRLRALGVDARVLIDEGFSKTRKTSIGFRSLRRRAGRSSPRTRGSADGLSSARRVYASGASAFRIWNTRSRPFIATVSAQGAVTLIEGGARLGAMKRR